MFLYFGDNPLSVASFAEIFFPLCKLSFHFFFFLWFPLLCKSSSLFRYHWFIFIFIILGGGSNKISMQHFVFFLRNFHTVFHSGYTNLHPRQHAGGFPFFHILTNTVDLFFSDTSHCDRCEVIFSLWFCLFAFP